MRLLRIILLLILSGCTTLKGYQHRIEGEKGSSYIITGVPVIKQKGQWCGPASLAMVLQYWNKETTQEEIAKEVFLPERRLTLNIDMERYAGGLGFWTDTDVKDLAGLKEKVKNNIPVIALIRVYPFPNRYHYLVIVGYDDGTETFITHAGGKNKKIFPYSGFLKRWKGAKCWCLIIVPPERITWALNDAKEYNKLGMAYERAGKFDLAIRNFSEAVRLEPQEIQYNLNLGNAYLRAESYQDAIKIYSDALKIDPDSADACNNLAWAYVMEGGNLDRVRALVEKAMKLNPEGMPYYLDTLGFFHLKNGDYNEAERLFKEALSLASGLPAELQEQISEHLLLASQANVD